MSPSVTREPFGELPEGTPVEVIHLRRTWTRSSMPSTSSQ